MFGLGLQSRPWDLTHLWRRPGQLARSLLAMNVVMPVFAVVVALIFDLHPAVKLALVIAAVSPVPPILPRKEIKAGGHAGYATGLLATAALFSIVFIPAAVAIIGRVFGIDAHMSLLSVAAVVLVTVLLPLVLGCMVASAAPRVAARLAPRVSGIGMLLLLVGTVLVLIVEGPVMLSLIGNGTLAAFVAFIVAGLVVGHALGGPTDEDRTVLALSTACRHPGVAVAIAGANAPLTPAAPEQTIVLAAVLLYVVVGVLVTVPYVAWRRRQPPGVRDAERKRAA